MRKMLIKDVGKVITGNTPSKKNLEFYNSDDIGFAKPDGIAATGITLVSTTKEYISEKARKKARVVEKGTVLVTCIGNIGKMGIVDSEELAFNQQINAIVPNENVLSKYLAYNMLSNKKKLEAIANAPVVPIINKTMFENFEITIHDKISDQEHIVKVLDNLTKLIGNRKNQLVEMDTLIKSRFVELFEDKEFEIVKAKDVCEFITKGTTPKSNEIIEIPNESTVPYLKVYNLSYDGQILFDEKPQFISTSVHLGKLKRSKVYPNDVLMNIVGPPLGKFALVPEEYKEWNINQAMAIFRATDKIIPLYLINALMQPKVLRPFIDSAVGIRQQNLNLEQCRNLEIPLPPLEIQEDFTIFAKQVDKLKVEVQNSLNETQLLFDSLMQKYFE